MKFTPQFRDLLQSELRRNKAEFGSESLLLMKEAFGTPYRIMLYDLTAIHSPFVPDLKVGEENIERLLKNENTPELTLTLGGGGQFWDNAIKFDATLLDRFDAWGTPAENGYLINSKKLEYKCKEEYWETEEHESKYTSISNFDCYIDPTYANEDMFRVKNYGNTIYNTDAWCAYFIALTKLNFPEFSFDEKRSSARMLRFLKPLGNGYFWGFEYDEKFIRNEARKGDLDLPYYFNLVLMNDAFRKGTKPDSYIYSWHEDIISLGILRNPFFSPPCMSLLRFKSVDQVYRENDPENYNDFNYQIEFKDNGNGTFTVLHPKELGHRLKRHAYYYMDILRYSTRPYLAYIEKSILNTLNAGV